MIKNRCLIIFSNWYLLTIENNKMVENFSTQFSPLYLHARVLLLLIKLLFIN